MKRLITVVFCACILLASVVTSGGSGLITMTGTNYTFFSADGLTQLKWNLGYIRNIY